MPIHTQEIAEQILKDNLLYLSALPISDLFRIRDLCLGLARYNLHDQDLLNETLDYLKQKIGE